MGKTFYSHFPCEGTPEHDGTCDQPKPMVEPTGVDLKALKTALAESQGFFHESLQRAFNGGSPLENEVENDNDGERVVPPAAKSGVYPAVSAEVAPDEADEDPYYRYRSGAI